MNKTAHWFPVTTAVPASAQAKGFARLVYGSFVSLALLTISPPAAAAAVSYTAGDATLSVYVVGSGSSDNGSGQSPFTVTTSYGYPQSGGGAAGNATASVFTLDQSLNGIQLQGTLSGTSNAGAADSLGVEASASMGQCNNCYSFTISDPTMVYLRADFSRSFTGYDPAVDFFYAAVCPEVGQCDYYGVNGLGSGINGGANYSGSNFEDGVLLDGGSYFLFFNAYDKIYGNVPNDTGTFNDTFNVQLQFTPLAAVPIPGAFWMFGSGLLGLIGFARRKAA
jgi:hypothetical protein